MAEIICFRKSKRVSVQETCRSCIHRKRCRPYQLWLQPELPFVFKHGGAGDSVFEVQNKISLALDSLFPAEYRWLMKQALHQLPGIRDCTSPIVRLKMFELMTQI